jgi:tetraacyldisaccharide 4'-kinase
MSQILKALLAPVALIYGLIVKIRNLLFDYHILKSVSFEKPIICIGNITVGGTGKTPHVEYLLNLLSNKLNTATLSRGYKRKTKGFKYVDIISSSHEVGDEPLQLKLKYPKVQVAVDADRVNGVSRLIYENPDLDIIILDDAFQHRWLNPGLMVLLIDYNRLVTRDYFLPLGRLRDSLREKRRADIILVTKCPNDLSQEQQESITKELRVDLKQSIYYTTMVYGEPKPIFKNFETGLTLNSDQEIFAFAGIANPTFFFSYIRSKAKLIESYTFPDHFAFTKNKIYPIFDSYLKSKALGKAIVTTEKDAARLRDISSLEDEFKKALFYIPIEVKFLDSQESNFNKQILTYARKN